MAKISKITQKFKVLFLQTAYTANDAGIFTFQSVGRKITALARARRVRRKAIKGVAERI